MKVFMIDLVLRVLFFCSILFLSYVGGVYSGINKGFLYREVSNLQEYLAAVEEKDRIKKKGIRNLYFKPRNNLKGVTTYASKSFYDGLTFFSGSENSAKLIDMHGNVVHEWSYPFEKAWPNPQHINYSKSDKQFFYWRKAHLFPNGDVMAIYENVANTPYGSGLIKIDKDSNLIWKYSASSHHDFDFDNEGNIYGLIHTVDNTPIKGLPEIKMPIIHDYIVKLSPEGKELKRVSVITALKNSRYKGFIASLPRKKGDITHTNNVEYATAEIAEKYDFVEEGNVLISTLMGSMLAVVDLDREVVVWAKKGTWRAQHDPDFLSNGNLMIFDNHGHKGPEMSSRIIEYDPRKDKIVWAYPGTKQSPFMSGNRGSQQVLPNGNILITEATNGRIFEITRNKKIVWEYYQTTRAGKNDEFIGMVQWAIRYKPEDLTFLKEE